jgi:hypothetical protein
MKKWMLLIICLLLPLAALAETYEQYFLTRPAATTPTGGIDILLMLQGGHVKQAPNTQFVHTTGNETITGDKAFTGLGNFSGQGLKTSDIIAKGPWVDPRALGAKFDGVTDDAAAINAAQVYANTVHKSVSLSGTIKVNSTITYYVPMVGQGSSATKIISGITDGSPVINIAVPHWKLEGFKIDSADGVSIQNFIGVNATTNCYDWYLNDIYVKHAAKGYNLINAWIGQAVNTAARFCTLGFYGEQLNATNLNLYIEGNVNGASIYRSNGVQIIGGVYENHSGTALQIDGPSGGISIDSYFEANATHINAGLTTGLANACNGVKIVGGSFASGSGYYGPINIDNVLNFSIDPSVNIGSVPVVIGPNAISYNIPPTGTTSVVSAPSGDLRIVDMTRITKPQLPPFNYFPNPRFTGGIRGYKRVISNSCTVSQETSNTIHGSALRVDYTAGAAYPGATILMPTPVLNELKGKKVWMMAKVFIPTTADTTYTYPAIPVAKPTMLLQTVGGSTPQGSIAVSAYWQAGSWNYIVRALDIPSDATDLEVIISPHDAGAGTSTVDGYIIVGELILTPDPVNFNAMNYYGIHPSAGRYKGQNWIGYDSGIPTLTGNTFIIGDEIENSAISTLASSADATAGQTYTLSGWRRLTNGAGNVLNTDWAEMRAFSGQMPAGGASPTFGGINVAYTDSSSSGTQRYATIAPTFNQSGSAGYNGLFINVTENSLGSGSHLPLQINAGGSPRFVVDNGGYASAYGGLKADTVDNISGSGVPLSLGSRNFSAAGTGLSLLNGTWSNTSGTSYGVLLRPTYNQISSTAANTDLVINRTETSLGSGLQKFFSLQVSSAEKFAVNNKGAVTGLNYSGAVTALAPGATVSLDLSTGSVFTLTPAQNETINITNATAGQEFTIAILTSGTSSYTLTFGTNFKSTGTLSTGSVDAKWFDVSFVCTSTTNCIERSRTTAQ